MAQTKVNIKRLVDNISKTNAYTPIVEAVVNSIDSIGENNPEPGEVTVTFFRDRQSSLDEGTANELPPFTEISITDNGIGFNEKI